MIDIKWLDIDKADLQWLYGDRHQVSEELYSLKAEIRELRRRVEVLNNQRNLGIKIDKLFLKELKNTLQQKEDSFKDKLLSMPNIPYKSPMDILIYQLNKEWSEHIKRRQKLDEEYQLILKELEELE